MAPRFANRETQRVAQGMHVPKFSAIAQQAERRIDQLVAATSLKDLSLPGLRLESLKGNRTGQFSIRINRQYRVCFKWVDGEAVEIEIVDYHD